MIPAVPGRRRPCRVLYGKEVTGMQPSFKGEVPLADHGLTLDDLRREFGDQWDIAGIAQGYRAILRDTGGHAPVALYGRTPAELAESIRMAQVSP